MTNRNPYRSSAATRVAPRSPSDLETSSGRPLFALWSTLAVALAGSLLPCLLADPFLAGLFFVPFTVGPLAVTAILVCLWRTFRAQCILTASSAAYALWFLYIYVFYLLLERDPQSPISLLFVGINAIPVLVCFWLAAGVSHFWRSR